MSQSANPAKRRRFLGWASGTLALAGLTGALPYLRNKKTESATRDRIATVNINGFLGALFGHELTPTDELELTDRVSYAVASDLEFGRQVVRLEQHIDRMARETGSADFQECGLAQRIVIVGEFMRLNPESLRSRLLGRFLTDEADLRRLRSETVGRLAWLYRHSGVPWRARGYTKWPGVPGVWDEYTRVGPTYPDV